jgi:hypothetical protein
MLPIRSEWDVPLEANDNIRHQFTAAEQGCNHHLVPSSSILGDLVEFDVEALHECGYERAYERLRE